MAPPPVPVGPAGDDAIAAPSASPTEEAAQPEVVDSTAAHEPVIKAPVDPVPAATAEPMPAIVTIEEEIPPDLSVPLMVCVDEVPPLISSGALSSDVLQPPTTDAPL
ncbi:MAG: hypothetical protein ACK56F_19720, partial [bacterium]